MHHEGHEETFFYSFLRALRVLRGAIERKQYENDTTA
jgi:hypothetical protein